MGDFNFQDIVTWTETEHGVVPNPQIGNTPQKRKYDILPSLKNTISSKL